jgi:hypothetical protein
MMSIKGAFGKVPEKLQLQYPLPPFASDLCNEIENFTNFENAAS